MIPADLTLETGKVLLRPLTEDDFDALHQLAQHHELWKYFTQNLADAVQLREWMQAAFRERIAGTRRPFAIIDKASNAIAGSSSMGNISLPDFRLEIGWSWLGVAFHGTEVNRHAKFAMMRYAFESKSLERVEFKTDMLNERAKQGLRKIGGTEEGVLRSHMTMWNNRRRDSIFFSILKNEWPGIRTTIFKDIA